jgi:hypothetical protein
MRLRKLFTHCPDANEGEIIVPDGQIFHIGHIVQDVTSEISVGGIMSGSIIPM